MRDHILKKIHPPPPFSLHPLWTFAYTVYIFSAIHTPLQHNLIWTLSPYYTEITLKKQSVTSIIYMPPNPVAVNQPAALHHLCNSVGCQTLVHHCVPNLTEPIPDSARSFIWPLSLVFVR